MSSNQEQPELLRGPIAQILPEEAHDIVSKVFARHPTFEQDPEEQIHLWLDLVNNAFPRVEDLDIAVVQALFNFIYNSRKVEDGPPIVWRPTPQTVAESNIGALMRSVGATSYPELHRWSVRNRDQFWKLALQRVGIVFKQPPKQILSSYDPVRPQWLHGAKYNIVESCFQAPPEQPALVWRDENETLLNKMSYRELQQLVNRVSNGLVEHGFKVGDPIAIDMPMTIESVAIYLGIIQAGMVAVSIADSFSSPEIEKRLRISSAKGIFTVDAYMRGGKKIAVYSKVLDAKPPCVIVLPLSPGSQISGLRTGDFEWSKFLSQNMNFHPYYASPDHHTNILFSSGTTGDPKAIPWTQLTPIKAAVDGHFHTDIHPGDVVCWPTNVGWMMGPWLIYQLINKATIALFYGAPSGTQFGKFVEDAGVTMLGTIPTMVKSWMQTRCMESCDWSSMRAFASTGECSHPMEVMYLLSLASYQAPLIEYCGGTEIGGGYITGTVVQDQALSAFSTPALGLDLVILGPDNKPVLPGHHGEVWLSPPSIGLSEVLLNRDHFKEYYQDTPKDPRNGGLLRRHGDQMGALAKGYFQALGRSDDTMNLGGIKVSSAELERCMAVDPRVSEVAAVGIQSTVGQTDLVAFVVPKAASADSNMAPTTAKQLKHNLQHVLRRDMNPLFKLYDVVIVDVLPKTASNKVMRRVLRDQYVQKKKKKQSKKNKQDKLVAKL